MKTEFLLQDRLQIQAPVELRDRDLTPQKREKLVDSFFRNEDETKRGLFVTFDLTHSGKVINNRIYQPWAQYSGIPTWLEPVGLPVIKNHDTDSDPIGRIIDMKWESLEDEARALLGDTAYNEVVEAYNSRDAKEIGRVMNKYGLIGNPKWKGLGKLVATAKITDRDAIEKFLDGRYMQFSAGAKTNRIQCSKCGHNIRMFDTCEHVPGQLTEDGDVAVMVTNTYNGREATVTAFPADRDAIVRHMTFDQHALGDNDLGNAISAVFTDIPLGDSIVLSDSQILYLDLSVLEDEDQTQIALDALLQRDVRDIARELFDGQAHDILVDALGTSMIEKSWLIRIHDALHGEYDWRLKYEGEDSVKQIPASVLKLHGKLHDMAVADGYRDDFLDGKLDEFDSDGAPSTKYVVAHARTQDQEETGSEPELEDDQPVDDADIDWFILDAALQGLLPEDAKLSKEKRDSLPDSAFCGPDRSFPVHDCAHYTAAKRLIGRYKGPGSKEKILDCIERKGKKLGCDGAVENKDHECSSCQKRIEDLIAEQDAKLQALKNEKKLLEESLAEALRDRESTADTLQKVLDFIASERGFEVSDEENTNRLDVLMDWFATISTKNDEQSSGVTKINLIPDASEVAPVEDPTFSEDEGEQKLPVSILSPFEQRIVQNYYTRIQDYSETNANLWLQDLKHRGMVSNDFDPNLYTLNSKE